MMDDVQKPILKKKVFGRGKVLLLIAFIACIFPHSDLYQCSGELEPEKRSEVPNPHSDLAFVKEVYVNSGDDVVAGQKLFLLREDNIKKQIEELETKLVLARQDEVRAWNTANSSGSLESPERASFNSQVESKINEQKALEKQLATHRAIQTNLEVLAPISGYISEPKSMQTLKEKGYAPKEAVLTVTDGNSDWYLKLLIPEEALGPFANQIAKHGLKNTRVDFYINGSWKRYSGTVDSYVQQLIPSKENEKKKNLYIKVKVDKKSLGLDDKDIAGLLHGASVTGNLYCGPSINCLYWSRSLRLGWSGMAFKYL